MLTASARVPEQATLPASLHAPRQPACLPACLLAHIWRPPRERLRMCALALTLRSSKSKVAAEATQRINPGIHVNPLQNRVSPETEAVFNDKFWQGQDLVRAECVLAHLWRGRWGMLCTRNCCCYRRMKRMCEGRLNWLIMQDGDG